MSDVPGSVFNSQKAVFSPGELGLLVEAELSTNSKDLVYDSLRAVCSNRSDCSVEDFSVRAEDIDGEILVTIQGKGSYSCLADLGDLENMRQSHQDIFQELLDDYGDLVEKSLLSKKQVLVIILFQNYCDRVKVADKLGMKLGTVNSHISRIREKLEKAEQTMNWFEGVVDDE